MIVQKKLLGILLMLCIAISLYAKTQVSTQGHDGEVTALAVATVAGKKVVYTGSDDGFLIRWDENGRGSHFQVSDDSIKMIAVHPNGNEIAVYESDGLTVNRISVWNWQTLTKKFASKRLDSTITSLAYTARGSQIMVGQANVMGIIFIDSARGTVLSNKVKETAGTVTFSQSSSSENSSVMYSALGYIIYTDLRNGNRKASFRVESNLQSPVVFNNDVIFAGKQDNAILMYDSTSGNLMARIYANNPIITTSRSDKNLYYFETEGRNATLKMIEVTNGVINTNPIILKTFSFQTWDAPSIAKKSNNEIYIGMTSGDLYSINTTATTEVVAAQKITNDVYDRIYDVNELSGDFYFLSQNSVFKSNYNSKSITPIAANPGYTNMITTQDSIYLWSKNTRKSVIKVHLNDNSQTTLFTPTISLQVLKLQDNKLLALEGSSKVSLYDLNTNELTSLYSGTGIQDALLYGDNVFVAKTSASNPPSPLVQVNVETKETTPINISGEVSFSLAENQTANGPFYGASIVSEDGKTSTKVFSYNPTSRGYSVLLSLGDEDSEAFTYLKNGVLYTNIGRTQVYSVTLSQKKLTKMEQSASLPLQLVGNRTTLAVLNKDGSISWFNAQSKTLLKNWYFGVDGEWLEL